MQSRYSIKILVGFSFSFLLSGCGVSFEFLNINSISSGSISFNGFDGGSFNESGLNGSSYLLPNGLSEIDSSIIDVTGLVGMWHLNEDPATLDPIVETSGSNLNGVLTASGGGTHGTSGQIGGGIDFDQLGDKIDIPTSAAVDNLGAMSISTWFYSRSRGNNDAGTILSKCTPSGAAACSDGMTDGWYFGWTTAGSGRMTFRVRFSGNTLYVNSQHGAIDNGKWTHVVVTYDGSNDAINGVKFYVDGAEVGQANVVNGGGSRLSDAGVDMVLGAQPIDGDFDGIIDETSLWERVLTPTEIADLFQEQQNQFVGEFDSDIFDSLSDLTEWNTLEPMTTSPMTKPLVGTSETAYPEDNLDVTHLVGYWNMDGSSGSNVSTAANDISSAGPVTISGTAYDTDSTMVYNDAQLSQGISFDGVEDYIEMENSPSLDITGNQITLMAWVKLDYSKCCAVSDGRIISKARDDLGSDVYAIYPESPSRSIRFRINTASGEVTLDTGVALPDGVWVHLAGIYDGTDMRVYINGELIGAPLAETGNIISSSLPVQIGSRQGSRFFGGDIDEVAIWNRAISVVELQRIFNRGANFLKYQVRSCSNSDCTGFPFTGPDGTSNTFYSEEMNLTHNVPIFNLQNVPNNRYFQYRVFFDGIGNVSNTEVRDIRVTGTRP